MLYPAAALAGGFFIGGVASVDRSLFGTTVAAWVQAVGSIAAIAVAGTTVSIQLNSARQAEVRARKAALTDRHAEMESVWEAAKALLLSAQSQLDPIIAYAETPGELDRWAENPDTVLEPIVRAQERLASFPSHQLGNGEALLAFVSVRNNLHFAELTLRNLRSAADTGAESAKAVMDFMVARQEACAEAIDVLRDQWGLTNSRFEARLKALR